MAEPFKNMVNKNVIRDMAKQFQNQWTRFDSNGFIATASKNLNKLELKQRTEQVTDAMIEYLPADFEKAGKIMLASLGSPLDEENITTTKNIHGINGWGVIPLTHYVGLKGYRHFDLSMMLFKEMTKRCTSEFGLRFFLLRAPKKTLSVMKKWTNDPNHHVRRLASEACRPRLPWATHIPAFIQDPGPVIELLERLKDDDEEYVRRSVANNLNDIAKDHPDIVTNIAAKWLNDASQERKKLVRHACRTLIKQGHKKTLRVLGYKPPRLKHTELEILTPNVKLGSALQFTLNLGSVANQTQAILVDYIIHHQKANGRTSPKVFKWRESTLPAKSEINLRKKHNIKKITTRVYYPGLHTLEVIVNGVSVARADFKLLIP